MDIFVTSSSDSIFNIRTGTLRGAIDVANNNVDDGPHTITFASGITQITFEQGELLIDSDITINLDGVTLVAGDNERFDSEPGRHFLVAPNTSLTLVDGTLTGGETTANGGSIFVDDGGELSVQGTTFTDNEGSFGGAIFATDADVNIIDAVFEDNTATTGGAIAISNDEVPENNTTTITSTVFADNTATQLGGAIALENEDIVISTSTFEDNEADEAGGAIFIQGTETPSTVAVNDSFFTGNEGGIAGGAIQNLDNALQVNRSSFFQNEANFGGAIATQTDIPSGTSVSVIGSTFSGNTATSEGGAIFNNGKLDLVSNTISENEAATGGGITTAGGTNGAGVVLEGNIIAGNTSTTPDVGDDLNWSGNFVLTPVLFDLQGFNIIGDGTLRDDIASDAVTLTITEDTDQVGTEATPLDPGLASLTVTDTGVFYDLDADSIARDTIAPDSGSAVLDRGLDQRGLGFLRIVDGLADAGAIESQDPLPSFVDAPDTVSQREGLTNVVNLDATDIVDDTDDHLITDFVFADGANDNDLFEIDAGTGQITFRTAPDFEDPQDSDRNNTYLVQVFLRDTNDFESAVHDITVTVTDSNESLVLSGLQDGLSATQGQTEVVDLSGVVLNNPEGDDVVVNFTIRAEEGITRAFSTDDVEVTDSTDGTYVTLQGTIADIATYLEGDRVFYTAPTSGSSSDTLFVQVDEIGFVGDVDTLAVTIAASTRPVNITGGTSGVVSGGASADRIITGDAETLVFAGAGDDVVALVGDGSGASGDDGDDIIGALTGDHFIMGGAGSDILIGGLGVDDIDGGSGNDVIKGDVSTFIGEGDVLSGGTGDDLIEGGLGADVFIFNLNDGDDTIGTLDIDFANPGASTVTGPDFESGVDQIELDSHFAFADSDAAYAAVSDVDGTAVFDAGGTTITFEGLTRADLSADDFILA